MPTGDILKATIEGTFDGEPFNIGLGFVSLSGAATFQDEANTLSNELSAIFLFSNPAGPFMGPLSEHFVVSNIRIQDLSPGVGASLVYAQAGVGGNTTDDALPPNDALCVTWRTGLKGKENRGRNYLTGFAEDAQVSGFWIGEIQDWARDAFASPLLTAFGPEGEGNYQLSVVHTVSGGARLVPPTATPILSYTIHNEVRSLRRRGIGVRISRRRAAP